MAQFRVSSEAVEAASAERETMFVDVYFTCWEYL